MQEILAQTSPITSYLNTFKPIGLEEMDKVKLLTRRDTKYILNDESTALILEALKDDYFIVEINGHRHMQYNTLYYDTLDYRLYTLHHNGKLNRYKVRSRSYKDTDTSFFEVKFKDNKGNTVKSRYIIDGIEKQLGVTAKNFITHKTTIEPNELASSMWVNYKRLTLVSKRFDERVTIDTDLCFEFNGQSKEYKGLVICELKQDKFTQDSKISHVLRDMKIEEAGMSKYCLGVASLIEGVKTNNFKEKILKIKKVTNT